ncbi:MAG: acyltransferase [Gemmatimonadota bacterium]
MTFLPGHIRASLAAGLRDLTTRPTAQVPGLDALRTLAVVLVVGAHYATTWREAHGPPVAPLANPFFGYGWSGVDLFFVLSGFLIGGQLWKELRRTGDVRVGRFLLRRGFRIWPLYFLFVGIALCVKVGTGSGPIGAPVWSAWPDITFTSNYFAERGVLEVGWSLATEEQFYLLVPLLILVLRKRVTMTRWPFVMLALVACVVAARAITNATLSSKGMTPDMIGGYMYTPFHLRSEGLFAGVLIAILALVMPTRFATRRGFSWAGAAMVGIAIVAATILRWADPTVFAFTTVTLVYASAVLFVLWDGSWVSTMLSARVFYPLSRLSYGMYLNHLYVVRLAGEPITTAASGPSGHGTAVFLGGFVVVVLSSCALAVVTFLAVERPFLLWRERYLGRAPG